MCGIVGYNGLEGATEVIFDGLMRLEYRGYDSAGVAVHAGKTLAVAKNAGKIRDLKHRIGAALPPSGLGIGHTRWATHGRPSDGNAHPHTSCDGRIAVAHNGIIENYLALRAELTARKHVFKSETDSEVLAHLIEEAYEGDLLRAVQKALSRVEGAFAIGVIAQDQPEQMVGARHSCPLIVGLGEGEMFLASDPMALLSYTRRVQYLDDGVCVLLTRTSARFETFDGKPVTPPVNTIDWNPVLAEKGGYAHFMLKEIHEQPDVLRNTIGGRTDDANGNVRLPELDLTTDALRKISRVYMVGCGTALYSGHVGKYLIENLAHLPVEVALASEFRYADPPLDGTTLVVAISQSGETADTLAAMRKAKLAGALTAAIVNVKGSTLTREVDSTIYIHAGPEIGVASTKAYTAMLGAHYLLAIHLGRERAVLTAQRGRELLAELRALPQRVDTYLKTARDSIRDIARKYQKSVHFLYLGRNVNYPTALEGALKLKELSYIHAEGFAAGEMKHGPIALIDEAVPTLAVATASSTYEKIMSNIKEVKARDGRVIALISEGDSVMAGLVDDVIVVPRVSEIMSPLVNVVPLQLLAYTIADLRGADVDQPRNLAKSVTVE